jgi:hypothetical protein
MINIVLQDPMIRVWYRFAGNLSLPGVSRPYCPHHPLKKIGALPALS